MKLPGGTVIWILPTGECHVTSSDSSVLFPTLRAYGTLAETRPATPAGADRDAKILRRKTTRAKQRSQAIADDRRHNQQRREARRQALMAEICLCSPLSNNAKPTSTHHRSNGAASAHLRDGEELPFTGHPFELMRATLLELKSDPVTASRNVIETRTSLGPALAQTGRGQPRLIEAVDEIGQLASLVGNHREYAFVVDGHAVVLAEE
ncbi:hypothetical protein AWB99_07175 [Mycolicibacterium confluentis]|uniref:Uncharacterized protein n=1 Tax=Mycolicibacterium confluentis TaxID=28047 RepID=A0A7I7XYK1_9MYCO|nr:hypothetical protein [Mycolicibacterium confluentis]ORV20226.1 hypothetical protein AWB99_07175 [Mycolicibacterium confluentis]BBZ34071.1 hypothetical protein MCNF_26760 [Mycolicibacterium confluentis]